MSAINNSPNRVNNSQGILSFILMTVGVLNSGMKL